MSLLLQAQWVIEASDFITQNGLKLFGVLGGTSGIVALLTFIGKLILVCVQGRIEKRNGTPLKLAFDTLREQISIMLESFKQTLENYKQMIEDSYHETSEKLKLELMSYLQDMIEKSQKIKIAIYDKLINEGENAQELLDELDSKIEESQKLIEDLKASKQEKLVESVEDTNAENNVEVIESSVTEDVVNEKNVERRKRKNRKLVAKRVIVEE